MNLPHFLLKKGMFQKKGGQFPAQMILLIGQFESVIVSRSFNRCVRSAGFLKPRVSIAVFGGPFRFVYFLCCCRAADNGFLKSPEKLFVRQKVSLRAFMFVGILGVKDLYDVQGV
jgi:hypothetical protein